MDLISARDLAHEWNISQRRVAKLCSEGRIEGAIFIGNMWLIPKHARKPLDGRTVRSTPDISATVRPIVKWAGGKGQILKDLQKNHPKELGNTIKKYAEPFIGGGAALFDILSKYEFEEVYLSDTNKELINVYSVVRNDPELLIDSLRTIQSEYIPLDDPERKIYYYSKRDRFNEIKSSGYPVSSVELASLFIFLNRTCFNGLYRVNSKGLFNVPIGYYKNPTICDENNILNVSNILQNAEIVYGDYRKSIDFIDEFTFAYFDPPYRPIKESSSFTSYTEDLFNDDNQRELADYVKLLTEKGAKIMVSNSDPKNTDPDDDFFDTLYRDYYITRIDASRIINSKSSERGKISELLITNYPV
jgi:DNA adenine methylase